MNHLTQLQQRLIVGSSITLLVLTAIYFSFKPPVIPFFAVLTATLFAAAVREYYQFARLKHFDPLQKIGILYTFVFVCISFYTAIKQGDWTLQGIAITVMLLNSFFYYFYKGKDPFVNLAITFFPIVYLVVPLSFMIQINYFYPPNDIQDGRWWLIYLLFVTKMTDVSAYFIGKNYGRNKMTTISPKKTWEGAIGGLLTAVAVSIIFWFLSQGAIAMGLSFKSALILGLLIGILSQIGDLSESLLKRDANVKDSSSIPGVGGMFDVVDSLLFTSPIVFFCLKLGCSA